ncbi:calcium-transporting ATPase 12, plasma membrane-type-like [Impatiens glandulifera]|uniref:calcium-transporting ATPase 12, plasma membrane-type-like n=1 Tax=Impatiens glandulifera TaxID=253017 RepID=UPI001FB19DEE|nr:calcium-transporting ATPase 12, plasma membrane-type-like [Impatiens glandulifera]
MAYTAINFMLSLNSKLESCTIIALNKSSKALRRWRLAYNAIYSSRALLSLVREIIVVDDDSSDPLLHYHKQDHHSLKIEEDEDGDSFGFSQLDKGLLADLVKDKNSKDLNKFGGVAVLARALKVDSEKGIHDNDEDIGSRKAAFGSNSYHKPPPKGLFHFVIEAFKDHTILILLVCATLSLGFGIKEHGIGEGWYEGGSIFVAVFLVVVVSSLSNLRQERQFFKLSKLSDNIQVEVLRDGRRQKISIFDIVVGDIVCLNLGNQIPADGLFIEGHSLQVDESSMTGESDHVEIDCVEVPFLISGSKVVDGYGKMIVTSVGMNTAWGKMMSSITGQSTNDETPLQARLNKLTALIGKVGLSVALLVLIVMFVRYFTGNTKDKEGNQEFLRGKTNTDQVFNSVVRIVSVAVTIVVVAIPEGLPLAVTLTLAYSMKRMMADQAMVRKLSACETMGSATVICTDKTGTLTMNQMTITKFWLGGDELESCYNTISPLVLQLLHQGVGLNTTGNVDKSTSDVAPQISGSPTEKAILSWAVLELRMDMELLKKTCKIVHVETFNSTKKRSGVLVTDNVNSLHTHWKGAAEMVLGMCTTYYDRTGLVRAIDIQTRNQLERTIEGMAASSLRCIAFAHKNTRWDETKRLIDGKVQYSLEEDGFTLLGIVGMKDPCRPRAKEAIEACRLAGVEIKMITGDNVFTAKAIATECGILRPNQQVEDGEVIEGSVFRNYTNEERMEKVDKIRVMARSTPMDKLLMVRCLRLKQHVVAVTGDGTNDAPALKEADIGLSMGIQGTEVAKESSDIVILDDDFGSVATVLRWGRCVYNNIQKFIQFQLTVNVAALVINFIAAVSSGEVPLTTVQLLWVNLIMDTLGALALATDRPTNDLMKHAPVGRIEPLITNVMWRNLLSQAFYQIAVLLTLQFRGQSIFGVNAAVKDTLIFNTFVLCQVFNEFNSRKLEKQNVFAGLHKNRLFMGVVGITIVLQVVMVEFLKKFADTTSLNWWQWLVCVGIAAVSWPISWLVKLIPVPSKPIFTKKNN